MSEPGNKAAASRNAAPDDLLPARVLAELEKVRHEPNRKRRAREAWAWIVRAGNLPDFPVLLDFALEHGLVQSPAAGAMWVNPVDGSEMVWVPLGPFFVGRERTRAECKGFSLARFPVTNAQFERFLAETGYSPPDDHPDDELFLSHWADGKAPAGKGNHPVVWVSYVDALHYCRWAGLTLPTEWQWEKAARGPEGRRFPWGTDSLGAAGQLTNVSAEDTCPVGSYPRTRTPYGCEDLVGNVSEWCQMTPEGEHGFVPRPTPEVPPLDGAKAYAAVRGSCFMRTVPWRMAAWHRRRLSITRRNYWVGFRPVWLLSCRPAE